MRFKIGGIGMLCLAVMACGKKPKDEDGYIGEPLQTTSSLYNRYGIPSSTMYLIDEASQRILQVDVDAMQLQQAYPLSHPEQVHTLLGSYEGAYVIDFSTKRLEIIRRDGAREEKGLGFQGTPVSAAYHPEKGILVMQDDLKSISLMMLSPDGMITKTWLGGSLMDKSRSVLAGDVDRRGRLLLATDDKAVVAVDVENSISRGRWDFTSFDGGVEGIYWLAPDPASDRLSLALAKDAIMVFDVEAKAVVDTLALRDNDLRVLGQSKMVKPHIVTVSAKTSEKSLYYINAQGRLESHVLPVVDVSTYTVSYLDAEAKELAVLSSQQDVHTVTKLRMADNLVLLNQKRQGQGEVRLGPSVMMTNRKSRLGYLEAYDFDRDLVKELKGFNFNYFRQHGL